jgi:lipopolysaccharide transport system permease protein
MEYRSAGNGVSGHRLWMRWLQCLLMVKIGLAQATLSGLSGGHLNGRASPKANELLKEVWRWRALVVEVAFQKTIARYRSFFIGPLWIILGFGLFVFGLAWLWSSLQNVPFGFFLAYVSIGLLSWNIVLGAVVDGCRCFQENRALIHQSRAPLLVYPLVTIVKHAFIAAHHLVVVLPVFFFLNPSLDVQFLWLIPGAFCLIIFSVSACTALAVVGAYFPDLVEIVGSVLRFAFFFTPVFWMPEARPDMELIWLLNPFYYAVECIRGPLLQTSEPSFIITIMAGLAGAAYLAAVVVYTGWARESRTRI